MPRFLLCLFLLVSVTFASFASVRDRKSRWTLNEEHIPTIDLDNTGAIGEYFSDNAKDIASYSAWSLKSPATGQGFIKFATGNPIQLVSQYATSIYPLVLSVFGMLGCMLLITHRVCCCSCRCCCKFKTKATLLSKQVIFGTRIAMIVSLALAALGIFLCVGLTESTPIVDNAKSSTMNVLSVTSDHVNRAVYTTLDVSTALMSTFATIEDVMLNTTAGFLYVLDDALDITSSDPSVGIVSKLIDTLEFMTPVLTHLVDEFTVLVDGIGSLCPAGDPACTDTGALNDLNVFVDDIDSLMDEIMNMADTVTFTVGGQSMNIDIGQYKSTFNSTINLALGLARDSLVALNATDLQSMSSMASNVVNYTDQLASMVSNKANYLDQGPDGLFQLINDTLMTVRNESIESYTNQYFDPTNPKNPFYKYYMNGYDIVAGGDNSMGFGLETSSVPMHHVESSVYNVMQPLAQSFTEEVLFENDYATVTRTSTGAIMFDRTALDTELEKVWTDLNTLIDDNVMPIVEQIDVYRWALFGLMVFFVPLLLSVLFKSTCCATCFLCTAIVPMIIVGVIGTISIMSVFGFGDVCEVIDATTHDPLDTAQSAWTGLSLSVPDALPSSSDIPALAMDVLTDGADAIFKNYTFNLNETFGDLFDRMGGAPTFNGTPISFPTDLNITIDLSKVELGAFFYADDEPVDIFADMLPIKSFIDQLFAEDTGMLRNLTIIRQILPLDQVENAARTQGRDVISTMNDTVINSPQVTSIIDSVESMIDGGIDNLIPAGFNASFPDTISDQVESALVDFAPMVVELFGELCVQTSSAYKDANDALVGVGKSLYPRQPWQCCFADPSGVQLSNWHWKQIDGKTRDCSVMPTLSDVADVVDFLSECELNFVDASVFNIDDASAFAGSWADPDHDEHTCGYINEDPNDPAVQGYADTDQLGYARFSNEDAVKLMMPKDNCPDCSDLIGFTGRVRTATTSIVSELMKSDPADAGLGFLIFLRKTPAFTCDGATSDVVVDTHTLRVCGSGVASLDGIDRVMMCNMSSTHDDWIAANSTCMREAVPLIFNMVEDTLDRMVYNPDVDPECIADDTLPKCSQPGLLFWVFNYLVNKVESDAITDLTNGMIDVFTGAVADIVYQVADALIYPTYSPFTTAMSANMYSALDGSFCGGGFASISYGFYIMTFWLSWSLLIGVIAAFVAGNVFRRKEKDEKQPPATEVAPIEWSELGNAPDNMF